MTPRQATFALIAAVLAVTIQARPDGNDGPKALQEKSSFQASKIEKQLTRGNEEVKLAPQLRSSAGMTDAITAQATTTVKDARTSDLRTAGCTKNYDFTYVPSGSTLYFWNHLKKFTKKKKAICGWWFWTDEHHYLDLQCSNIDLRDEDYMVMYEVDGDTHHGKQGPFTSTNHTMRFDSTNVVIGLETTLAREDRTFNCEISSVACPSNTYKDGTTCTECPISDMSSPPASNSITDCVCPSDTYEDGVSCTGCPDDLMTSPSGSKSITDCVCPAIFTQEGNNCECPSDTYEDLATCTRCPDDSMSSPQGSTSIADCVCPSDTYEDLATCTDCPDDMMTSPQGSTSDSDCVCPVEYTRDVDTCECEIGNYETGETCMDCQQPVLPISPISPSLSECFCANKGPNEAPNCGRCCTVCDVKLNAIPGVALPMYSHAEYGKAKYSVDYDCDRIIEAPSTKKVKLTFFSVDIEIDSTCSFDYVEVFSGSDDTGTSLVKFCGENIPSAIVSTNEALFVRFHSDDAGTRYGFIATYEAID